MAPQKKKMTDIFCLFKRLLPQRRSNQLQNPKTRNFRELFLPENDF